MQLRIRHLARAFSPLRGGWGLDPTLFHPDEQGRSSGTSVRDETAKDGALGALFFFLF